MKIIDFKLYDHSENKTEVVIKKRNPNFDF